MFKAIPLDEEVCQVIFGMDGESAAGPNGFTERFFMFAWKVIAKDVYDAVVHFFCGA